MHSRVQTLCQLGRGEEKLTIVAKVTGIIAFKKEVKDMHQQDDRHVKKSFHHTATKTATEYSKVSSLHGIQIHLGDRAALARVETSVAYNCHLCSCCWSIMVTAGLS